MFASVRRMNIWDIRQHNPVNSIEAHMNEVMSVDYSPFEKNLIITGSADKSVAVWDCRNLKSKLFSLRQHKEEVS